MATIRMGSRRRRFTSINRDAINDRSLSFRARGVLHWLLDKPDDWRCDSAAIAHEGTEGREAIRTALNELVTAGYLVRRKTQGDDGRWATETFVYEDPTDVEEEVTPGRTEAQEPDAGSPDSGSPAVGALGALPLEGLRQTTETSVSEAPVGCTFDDFWSVYPRKVAPDAARKAWDRVVKGGKGRPAVDPTVIVAGAERYAAARAAAARRDGPVKAQQFTAHPTTWLNAGRWNDEAETQDRGRDTGVDTNRDAPSGRMADDEV